YVVVDAVFVAPGGVALEAEHEARHLPVVANRATGKAAPDVVAVCVAEAGGRIDVIAEADRPAGIEADIEAGPIIEWDDRRRRFHRQISRPNDCRREKQGGDRAEEEVLCHGCLSKLSRWSLWVDGIDALMMTTH